MAKLDDLIAQVGDQKLRDQLQEAAAELRRRKKFGLVYEQHIPETALLSSAGIRKGSVVMIRTEPTSKARYVVDSLTKTKAKISSGDHTRTIPTSDLLVVKPFGEPVYPVLRFTECVFRAEGKPFHAVINGENFHALQLLLFAFRRRFDVIYIDPPYNVGARDWTYNNDFVDINDAWRHSKWLSMMEKRLRLAKTLLAPNGVLIVTIDEHETSHLGVLLEEVFPEARRQIVTIVNNAAGVSQGGFYRVEEYAYFCFMGSARPGPIADDLLSDESKVQKTPLWFSMIRYGGINALPSKRAGLVYPIAIDPKRNRIVGTGRTLKERSDAGEIPETLNGLDDWRPDPTEHLDGCAVVWPYRGDGSVSTWQLKPETLLALAKEGFVRVRVQTNGPGGNQWSISYIKSATGPKFERAKSPTSAEKTTMGRTLPGRSNAQSYLRRYGSELGMMLENGARGHFANC